MSTHNQLVAVYGSLRMGLSNHRVLGNSEFVGLFRSKPEYTLHSLHGGYPGLKMGGEDSVVFEVYSVDETIAYRVDMLEGYTPGGNNTFYDKHQIKTPFGIASTYEYQPQTDTRLMHGNWTMFKTGNTLEGNLINQLNETEDEVEQARICEIINKTSPRY